MILTCPQCATRFFADDNAIGSAGRRVECDACGKIWLGQKIEPPEPNEVVALKTGDGDPRDLSLKTPNTAGAAPAIASPLFVEHMATAPRVKSGASRTRWAIGLLFAAFAIVTCLLMFQREVTQLLPAMDVIYRSVGATHSGGAGG